jgi:hypothetical protein
LIRVSALSNRVLSETISCKLQASPNKRVVSTAPLTPHNITTASIAVKSAISSPFQIGRSCTSTHASLSASDQNLTESQVSADESAAHSAKRPRLSERTETIPAESTPTSASGGAASRTASGSSAKRQVDFSAVKVDPNNDAVRELSFA